MIETLKQNPEFILNAFLILIVLVNFIVLTIFQSFNGRKPLRMPPPPSSGLIKSKGELIHIRERICNAVHKCLQWEDGEIAGIDMLKLEQQIDGILHQLQKKND